MLDGLHQISKGDTALPCVLQFCSEPSKYFLTDDSGHTHVIHLGEGGEQGDALMPMLRVLGPHGALLCLRDFVVPHEHFFACLDNLHVVCLSDRVGPIFGKNPGVESRRTCATRLPGDARSCGTR